MFRAKWFAKHFEEYKYDKKYLIYWLEKTSFAQNMLGMYRYFDEGRYKVEEGFAVPSLTDRIKVKFHYAGQKVKKFFKASGLNA